MRRISVEVKSDSLVGTDQTTEDFNTFSGRAVRWNFKFLGWRDLLCVMDSKYDYAHYYGPNGLVPDDVWSLRRFAVVERTPKEPHHPYSSVVMFWDAEDWHPWMALMFDRQKNLFKSLTYTFRWSEDYDEWAEINHGVHVAGTPGAGGDRLQRTPRPRSSRRSAPATPISTSTTSTSCSTSASSRNSIAKRVC